MTVGKSMAVVAWSGGFDGKIRPVVVGKITEYFDMLGNRLSEIRSEQINLKRIQSLVRLSSCNRVTT